MAVSASANRVRIQSVREVTAGTTPTTPRMRLVRTNDERFTFAPQYIDSAELRYDRMSADSIKVMQAAGGGFTFEMSYPDDNSPLSDFYRSAFYEVWSNTPTWDNDGTADSVITDAGTVANTYAVTSGADAVVVGHLVRATGFTNAANNQVFRVTTGGASPANTIAGTGLGLAAEAAPPGTAKLKVVGFAGVSGDITASSTGLGATTLNFTTLGLKVGQWIKVGGLAAGDKFSNVAANNDWIRVTAIAAATLTCDNLPLGWGVDNGAGKTIKCWFGDTIKNGSTQTSLTFETGFMDQAAPTYITNTGMVVNTLDHNITARQVITGTLAFMGQGGGQSTTSLDTSPDAATTGRQFAAHANVGRLSDAGSALRAPNWASGLTFQIANNNRVIEDISSASPQGINAGQCAVTGRITSKFGDNTMLAKLYAGTPSSIASIWMKDNQALVWQFPRITYRGGDPQATGLNTDIDLALDWRAALDSVTGSQVILDRVPYYEISGTGLV